MNSASGSALVFGLDNGPCRLIDLGSDPLVDCVLGVFPLKEVEVVAGGAGRIQTDAQRASEGQRQRLEASNRQDTEWGFRSNRE
jgi:hypothetical protein